MDDEGFTNGTNLLLNSCTYFQIISKFSMLNYRYVCIYSIFGLMLEKSEINL